MYRYRNIHYPTGYERKAESLLLLPKEQTNTANTIQGSSEALPFIVEHTIEVTMPLRNGQVRVQLIVSGSGGAAREQGADGVSMCHVYAACLPPYALGIPKDSVQLYCSPRFFGYKGNVQNAIDDMKAGNRMGIRGDVNEETVFPGKVAQGEEFFEYFWDIFGRSAFLEAGVPLSKCEIRIISGHSCNNGGNPAVTCGATVPFSELEVVELGTQRNASVLTVLDCPISPRAVQGLKNPNYQVVPKGSEFDDVNFPVVCSKLSLANCFRLSWDGHHSVGVDDVRFAPEDKDDMSEPVGFPIICSLMVAVKARYIDRTSQRALGDIFVDQYLSIHRRYVSPYPISVDPTPHHKLDILQRILDSGVVRPKAEAFDCLLYQRNNEWFTTAELEASLYPSGKEAAELAKVIAKFVSQQVLEWHSMNKPEYMEPIDASEFAWLRLSQAMGIHCRLLAAFTITSLGTSTGETIRILDGEEVNEHGLLFRDWATACEILPGIVDKVVAYIQDNEGKTLWDYAGIDELAGFEEEADEHGAQGMCPNQCSFSPC